MSFFKTVWIYCDGPNCPMGEEAGCEMTTTAKEARRELKFDGWINRGSLDFCPECATDADRQNSCKKCGGEMIPSKATGQTYKSGMPDFPGDERGITMSPGGPGGLVDVLKCSDCGWSVTADLVSDGQRE